MSWTRIAYIFLILFTPLLISAQTTKHVTKKGFPSDSIIMKDHSVKKATLYSLFPGAGQFYNRRYWKIPIVYAGLFITGSFVVETNQKFKDYKNEAINRYNFDTIENFPDLTDDQVLEKKNFYERQRNLNILIFFGVYILQIVDATVDAQFFNFDVSDDVSLHAEPYFHQSEFDLTAPINSGITLSLNF